MTANPPDGPLPLNSTPTPFLSISAASCCSPNFLRATPNPLSESNVVNVWRRRIVECFLLQSVCKSVVVVLVVVKAESMMNQERKSKERGSPDIGWLESSGSSMRKIT